MTKAIRTVSLDGETLNVIDDVIPSVDTKVRWNMLTMAKPVPDGNNRLILSSGTKKMMLEVVSPENAEVYIMPAEGGEGEKPNPDYTRIGFTADLDKGHEYELRVTLKPIQ